MNIQLKTFCLLWLSFTAVTTSRAQMILSDRNWDSTAIFFDNFTPPRSNWNSNWFDYPNNDVWRAHPITGITHDFAEHQVYQRSHAIMDATDSTLKLRAEYAGGRILADTLTLPPNYYHFANDSLHPSLYYYSGAVTAIDTFRYGYFEGRMKLPANRGAFPAFWLFNNVNGDYQEIDIFEVSYEMNPWSTRGFFGTMWVGYNNNPQHHYTAFNYTIPTNEPDITNWHTYGLEWSPKRIVWYFDNQIIGELLHDSVPIHPMYLMMNYALDNWVMLDSITPIQTGFPNDMVIDYVRVNKLKCNCTSDVSILNTTQLTNYVYEVKKSVTIDGGGTNISLPSNSSSVFRATDYLLIDTDFEVPLGSTLELTTHTCPQ